MSESAAEAELLISGLFHRRSCIGESPYTEALTPFFWNCLSPSNFIILR
jgi:hypothetical protein